jgi:hypothetical protein
MLTVCNRIASEAALLVHVAWLEIRGKIETKMLSPNSTYGVYLVFRLVHGTYGLGFPFQEGSVTVGVNVSTRRACLDSYIEDGARGMVHRKYDDDGTQHYWIPAGSRSTVLVEATWLFPGEEPMVGWSLS